MTTEKRNNYIGYGLIIVGAIISLLTELEKISPTIKKICGGETGGCARVAASDYSSLFGVPLGILGIIAYIILAYLYKYEREKSPILISVMMGAEVYFVFLQISVIKAICPLCMANFAVVVSLSIFLFTTISPKDDPKFFRGLSAFLAVLTFLLLFIPYLVNEDAKTSATKKSIPIKVESMTSWGDSNSLHRLEIFTDYQCPHCARYEPTVKAIMENYPNIYIVFRDVILNPKGLSPMAISINGAVAFYKGREAYLKARLETFENQKNLYNYLAPRFKMLGDDIKMKNAVKFKVQKDYQMAEMFGVRNTPTTIMISNGKLIDKIEGGTSFEKIKPKLDAFLKK